MYVRKYTKLLMEEVLSSTQNFSVSISRLFIIKIARNNCFITIVILFTKIFTYLTFDLLFHDGSPYHIETSPVNCSANQQADFYMIRISFMKELNCWSIQNNYIVAML